MSLQHQTVTAETLVALEGLTNLESLDLPDDYFDAYFSNSVINFTKNPTKVMSEAYRTLAKGGRAGFSLLGRSAGSNFTQVTKEIVISHKIQA